MIWARRGLAACARPPARPPSERATDTRKAPTPHPPVPIDWTSGGSWWCVVRRTPFEVWTLGRRAAGSVGLSVVACLLLARLALWKKGGIDRGGAGVSCGFWWGGPLKRPSEGMVGSKRPRATDGSLGLAALMS